jgi:hypothetical protein
MPIKYLTIEQHHQLLKRLLNISRRVNNNFEYHSAGLNYTSLMICFLLQNMSSVETLLRLSESFNEDWFPSTVGYMVDRSLLEIDINAHYISNDRAARANKYIEFGRVIKKRELDVITKHMNTARSDWHQLLELWYQNQWIEQEKEINDQFNAVKNQFEVTSKRGRKSLSQNWSGKNIREMAREVNHEIEYDVFYAKLSSFVHADIRLADQFLRVHPTGPLWTQKIGGDEIGFVFSYAATFFDCFLKLFGTEFKLWTEHEVSACWNFE